ncbi:MAG: hypothetical protein M3282_02000, partial [Gemmatimonadota bacterium]|nr:hypothetical protein [Gemmatimonadota bacterium]
MRRSIFRTALVFATLAAVTPLAAAHGQGDGLVNWSPRRPKQGALFRLVVDGVTDPRAVTGT